MHWEARLRQQRRQLEHFEPVTGDFRLAIDAGFGFGSFVAALQFVEKLLRIFAAGLPAFGARHHRLRGIGADKLWPILLQQLGARENISPHNFSIHRDQDTATDAAPTKLDLTIRRDPSSSFDTEDTQVDRIALVGHDTVFADHAILLAASHYLASEK